jgi:ABC-2 type transport system permease protein
MNWVMRRFRAGSFGWLFFHELRVASRGGKKPLRTRVIGLVVLAALVAAGCLAAQALRNVPIASSPLALAIVLTSTIGLLSFMTTQAMIGSQRTLYERADLDLLFTAPINPTIVLLAKLCGIAGSIVLSYAFLLLPFVIPIAAVNHPGLFGVPLVLIALALVAACIGLAIT